MPSRRDLLRLAAIGAAGASLPACDSTGYEWAVRETWRHGPAAPVGQAALLRELVRYATLAANSHNTQPWRFALDDDAIVILPDQTRRTPVVDPDDHHLWVSLGCAAENLVLAAAALGRRAETVFDERSGAVRAALAPMAPVRSPLFAAIPQRQCTRAEYDGGPVPAAELRALESTASGPAVRVLLLTDRARIDAVTEFVTQANSAQLRDAAFREELKRWIRFGDAEAVATRDGLSSRSTGNPSIPRWLGDLIFATVVTEQGENDKIARQLRSSAGVAVFVAENGSRANWVEVGRACQRFALLAASLGIRSAFLNQPVEVTALRPQFAQWLGIGGMRPDLVVRFGRGPLMPPSLRRQVDTVFGGTGPPRTARGSVARSATA